MSPAPDGLVDLAYATRGPRGGRELVHRGAVAAVDARGRLLAAFGDPDARFTLRSTAKPFQLLPFLIDGLDRLLDPGEADADLAVMMASHSGEPVHVERVAALLARFGLSAADLQCGVHPPYDPAAREALIRARLEPEALHCNCSGKHAAMLAVCRHRGWSLERYLEAEHPLARRIEAILGAVCDHPDRFPVAVDGCSLPTWWVPLRALALAYARLADPSSAPLVEDRPVAPLLERLVRAATAHPHLVGGTGRTDTLLMRAARSRVIAKSGAAGMHAIGIRPGPGLPHGLGIAVKVADGDPGGRVRRLLAADVLGEAGLVDRSDPAALGPGFSPEVRNLRGAVVGRWHLAARIRC